MTFHAIKSQRLSLQLATYALSAGLLLTACSDNNTTDNTTTDSTAADAQVDTASLDKHSASEIESDNDMPSLPKSAAAESTNDVTSDVVNPVLIDKAQPSLVTNPTTAGTPEDTVKQALDSLYYGDVEKSATYYKVDIANFTEELKNTQYAFQQTVEAVTITETTYNKDKTKATINGELMLKDQSKPAALTYELQKIEGKWKILG